MLSFYYICNLVGITQYDNSFGAENDSSNNKYDLLKDIDPVAANRIHPNNHRKVGGVISSFILLETYIKGHLIHAVRVICSNAILCINKIVILIILRKKLKALVYNTSIRSIMHFRLELLNFYEMLNWG